MQAGSLLLNGAFGWIYWGLAILLGLLVPIAIEQLELMHGHFPIIQKRLPATLKLIGRLALRFVIVYAGLLTVI
jgi:formate-dependent nitrite reductase membrane component NrfD